MSTSTLPTPIDRDSRICFGILYFATAEEADAYAAGTKPGQYNGGFFHGMGTGRDRGFDHVGKDGVARFAVTTA